MKGFIKKACVFVAGLAVINVVFLAIANKVYFKDYEQTELNYDTYILSDSHGLPLEQYAKEYGVYNFSAGSDSYFDMYTKLKYLVRSTKVKRIIITADDHALSMQREDNNNMDRSAQYSSVEDYDNAYQYFMEKYVKRYVVLLNPKCRDIVKVFIAGKLDGIDADPKTGDWSKLPAEKQDKHAQARARKQFGKEESSKDLTTALEKIIALCRKKNIELIGLKYPLTQKYLNIVGERSYHADSLMMRHGLKVYDFKELYKDSDNYFVNQDHLNERGGKAFIKVLAGGVLSADAYDAVGNN